eukprot:scaffold322248_cov37-Prasinocladus_malaysianus.AAC.1
MSGMVSLSIPAALLDRVQLLSSLLYGGSASVAETFPDILELAIHINADMDFDKFEIHPILEDCHDVHMEVPQHLHAAMEEAMCSNQLSSSSQRGLVALVISALAHRLLAGVLERVCDGSALTLSSKDDLGALLGLEVGAIS